MNFNINRAKSTLVIILLAGMVVNFGIVTYTYLRDAIYAEDLQHLSIVILSVHSVPLGVVIGGIFGQRRSKRRQTPMLAFYTAVGLTLIWSFLLLTRTAIFGLAEQDSVSSLADYLSTVSASGSFLVGGALAYFFAK
jgi:hypothetical protein